MKLFTVLLVMLVSITGFSQSHVKCFTDEMEQELIQSNPDLADYYNNYYQQFQSLEGAQKTTGTVYKVPVVFHIIYENDQDNISRAQVLDGLRVINEDFRRQNTDKSNTRSLFTSVAADLEVEFELAKLDPSGNCTDGITRTFSTATEDARDNVKDLIHWDNKKYLNIWVVRTIGSQGAPGIILGYAYKPKAGQSYKRDGILIRHDRLGAIGTAYDKSLGRTLTHEVGHYLGLDHPFKNGCTGGDFCNDTPPVASASNGCNHNKNSCSNDFPDLLDQVENYMDYSDDDCMNMFTQDQKTIVRASLANTSLRGSLISTNNYQTVGLADNQVLPCAPVADYQSDLSIVCEGGMINFTDMTFMGNATSYQWVFDGGTPSTSTSKNPNVVYNTKGNFAVSLVVGNASGTHQEYRNGMISVRTLTPVWLNQFGDDFESWNVPNNNWHVERAKGSEVEFKTTNAASVSGSKSVLLECHKIINKEKHELISNVVNLGGVKTVDLKFKHAFARKTNSSLGAGLLKVYASKDCGDNWLFIGNFLGPLLETASPTDAPFVPGQGDWKDNTLNMSSMAFESSVMFKFEFTNNGGNNFYLDDVQLEVALGDVELEMAKRELKLFPNPTNGSFTIGYTALKDGDVSIEVYNMTGKLVAQPAKNEKVSQEYQEYKVDLIGLPAGVYMVRVSDKNQAIVKKIILH